jgi:hypothetical protein
MEKVKAPAEKNIVASGKERTAGVSPINSAGPNELLVC